MAQAAAHPGQLFPRWSARAQTLVAAALNAADPAAALRASWVPPPNPAAILAVGKAAIPMARAALPLLPPALPGLLTTPPHADPAELRSNPALSLYPCDHPYPTARNLAAASAVAAFIARVPPDADLVFLLSGGGSAHLSLPAPGLSLDDVAGVTRDLQLAGADIRELNTVRKHAELLKGGGLAARCPGRIAAYVLSDVPGDPLDVIASGPAAPDPTTYAQALAVLARRGLAGRHPRLEAHLASGAAGRTPETPKPGDPRLSRVTHRVIAGNRGVVLAVRDAARALGFEIAGVEHAVEGDAATVGRALARRAADAPRDGARRAWILGGETTVRVGDAAGAGGPSQELALAAAQVLDGAPGLCVITFSTDGRDGPTDAAGAVVTGDTWAAVRRAGLDPAACLAAHDSHAALDRAGALLRVPPTGTNLNHVAVALAGGPG